jgi:hypothetical protein
MFKKVLFLAAAMFFVFITSTFSDTSIIKSYTIESTAVSSTYIDTTIIVPNQSLILGFSVNPFSTGVSQAALWDEESMSGYLRSVSDLFAEMSNPASKGDIVWFVHPKMISTQLHVTSTANTNVVIYYTK